MYQYRTRYAELIEPYKLGRITTEQFLRNLAILFNMDEDHENAPMMLDRPAGVRYSNDPKLVQLEAAWNAMIGLREDDGSMFSSSSRSNCSPADIQVISQYGGDRTEAARL